MGCRNGGVMPAGPFALVSYIPDPLGIFLDRLRLELVPDCSPHAHVTVLPPRPICASELQAAGELLEKAEQFAAFEVELADVEIFPVSKVVYIGLARGEQELREMYRALNQDAVFFREAFPYHPHVTLAQNFSLDELERISETARRRWREYRHTRRFSVESLDFVRNLYGSHWTDLANIHLKKVPVA